MLLVRRVTQILRVEDAVLVSRADLDDGAFEVREELAITLRLRDAAGLAEDNEPFRVLPYSMEQREAVDAVGTVAVARCEAVVERECERRGE